VGVGERQPYGVPVSAVVYSKKETCRKTWLMDGLPHVCAWHECHRHAHMCVWGGIGMETVFGFEVVCSGCKQQVWVSGCGGVGGVEGFVLRMRCERCACCTPIAKCNKCAAQRMRPWAVARARK